MLDIIIPTTYSPQLTYDCIRSIFDVIKEVDYMITVVDNASAPEFGHRDPRVKSIRFEQRLGFSRAMNEGVKATTNENVLLLNNDTVMQQPNFLKNMLETLESDPKMGIVSPMTNFIGNPTARASNKESLPNRVWDHQGHVAAVCWMLKRDTINKIGPFDENFINSHQDGDYCQRILNAGYKVYIDGRCFIFHHGSRSVSQTPGYYESFQKASDYYNKKWSAH